MLCIAQKNILIPGNHFSHANFHMACMWKLLPTDSHLFSFLFPCLVLDRPLKMLLRKCVTVTSEENWRRENVLLQEKRTETDQQEVTELHTVTNPGWASGRQNLGTRVSEMQAQSPWAEGELLLSIAATRRPIFRPGTRKYTWCQIGAILKDLLLLKEIHIFMFLMVLVRHIINTWVLVYCGMGMITWNLVF